MSAFFDIYPSPRPTQGEGRSIHPRLVDASTLTSKELASKEEHASTLTDTDMLAALGAVRHYLLSQLSDGGRVHLDGIGTFSVVPHFKSPKYEGDKVSGKDVALKRINFQPEPGLSAEISASLNFIHRTAPHSAEISLDEVKALLSEYFLTHADISLHGFCTLAHLRQFRARKYLTALLDEAFLSRRKVGNTYLYMKPAEGK